MNRMPAIPPLHRGIAPVICAMLIPFVACSQQATLEPTVSLRTIDNITVPFQNRIPMPSFEKQHRPGMSLAGQWRKQRFNANHDLTMRIRDSSGYAALVSEAAGRFLISFDDSGWELKDIPGVENTMNGYEHTPETYENGVWYRRRFTVADSVQGGRALLKFLAVNYVADVWLNGTYLGWHEGGYTPFAFDVTPELEFGTENVLTVRVDNIPWNPTQTPNPTYGFRNDIVPYYRCDWFNYTGIIHDVYLECMAPSAIVRADVVPLDTSGTVTATVVVQNADTADGQYSIDVQVADAVVDSITIGSEYSSDLAGNPVAVGGATTGMVNIQRDSVRVWRTTLAIPGAHLWSPRHPNLYVLTVTLSKDGIPLDRIATEFGVRTVSTAGSTFLFNGKPLFMPGIARHEDHPVYGRSVPHDVILSDLKKIRSFNVSLLRTAHYPNDPYTYLIADRLGIATLEEIPVWWFDTDEAWSIQNDIRHIHTQMWREMVFKDYNRPSVILWSTCNECLAVPGRQTFIDAVNHELDVMYPDGRLVTQSAAADRPGASDASESVCDVAGWTMYFGIFHGGTYYAGTKQFLQDAHAAHPDEPILDTEFGYWSGESGTTQSTQVSVFNFTFLAFSEVTILDANGAIRPGGFLMGTTWWCAFDWYTSQQSPPTGFQSMGVYHMDRATPKSVAPVLTSSYRPYYENSELTAVEEVDGSMQPGRFSLSQNYPNPFNPETSIEYTIGGVGGLGSKNPIQNSEFLILHSPTLVRLAVYDLLGREVAVLVNEAQKPGTYTVRFDSSAIASGVYMYQLVTPGFMQSRKMVVMK